MSKHQLLSSDHQLLGFTGSGAEGASKSIMLLGWIRFDRSLRCLKWLKTLGLVFFLRSLPLEILTKQTQKTNTPAAKRSSLVRRRTSARARCAEDPHLGSCLQHVADRLGSTRAEGSLFREAAFKVGPGCVAVPGFALSLGDVF